MSITHKFSLISVRIGRWLACLLIAGVVLLPAPALAASKTYAVACDGSNVQLYKNTIECSAAVSIPNVEGIGGAKKPYPNNDGVATLSVNCGKNNPIDPKVGAKASFKCRGGSSPKIGNLKAVQKAGSGGGGGAGGGGR